jgi:ribosomal protein L11 methyltransferase
MAFGTGNHETTRLCALRLIDTAFEWGATVKNRSVIDAGCGSGILAISAAKLGFGNVSGFDIDNASVQISRENAAVNGLGETIHFSAGALEASLPGKQADLVLANILADVLMQNADLLLGSVLPGGKLVLSGILAIEIGSVRNVFESRGRTQWGFCDAKSRIDGEWTDLVLLRPL